jgi:predicted phosphodiesterase
MFERKKGESKLDYTLRLVGKKLEDGDKYLDWQDIVDLAGWDCHYDSLRKAMQPSEFGGYAIYKHMLESGYEGSAIKKLEEKIKESKIEVQKLRDLRSGYRENQIRNTARKEAILEEIAYYTKDIKPLDMPDFKPIRSGDIKSIFGIADAHYGKELIIEGLNGEPLNVYNPEVFEERMERLLQEYINIIDEEGISEIVFVDLSDSIEGVLRASSLQYIKYGIIESAIKYAEYMANWINKLSEYVEIDYYSCLGNHCELRTLNSKSGEFAKENMQYVIDKVLSVALSNNDRVKINQTKAIQYIDIDGFRIMATHGQNERDLVKSAKEYKEIYDVKADLMISGHLHNSKQETASLHTKCIQFPSLIGIDDFSMKIKKTAKPEGKAIIKKGKRLVNIDIEI